MAVVPMIAVGEIHRAWRTLPVGSLDDVIGAGTCVVLAPHPDDESLGCGGLIARCVAAGRPPLVVVLTDGTGSHPHSPTYPAERLRAVREQEVLDATACLGLPAERVVRLREKDTAAPHDGPGFDAVVQRVVRLIRAETACTAILAPWRHDPHCDHTAAALVTTAAAAATGVNHVAYPVWGWTLQAELCLPRDPMLGLRLDVGAVLTAKRAAIRAHRSQYGGLITDDPTGFQLPAELLSIFNAPFETFLWP